MNTAKLSSRFGRGRKTGPAEPAAAPEAAPAAPEKIAEAGKPAEAEAETARESGTPASDPAPASAEPAPASPSPARGSRLVEGDRIRPQGNARPPGGARPPFAASWAASRARLAAASTPVAAAAAIVAALGLGYGIGQAGRPILGDSGLLTGLAADLHGTGAEVAHLSAELKALKLAVEGFKAERDKTRSELLARQAQVSEKLDRAGGEMTARATRMTEQLDRIEKTQRDPSRYASLTERLERLERAGGAAAPSPTPPPKPVAAAATPDVTQTGSVADPKPVKPETDPRKTQIEGFFVRDYDEGFALIESRAGRFLEVAVGYTVPGIGRVEAIERRGRQWVVVTSKGFIAER